MAAIVLAAGLGKRMQSDLPKVLHSARGRPLVRHVLEAVHAAGIDRIVVVVGHQADRVQEALKDLDVGWALQVPQLGTAHAVQQTAPHLAHHPGDVVVLCGDTPLLTASTLRALCAQHRQSGASATVLTAVVDDSSGYGRILRNEWGDVLRIVEHKDASPEERQVRGSTARSEARLDRKHASPR